VATPIRLYIIVVCLPWRDHIRLVVTQVTEGQPRERGWELACYSQELKFP